MKCAWKEYLDLLPLWMRSQVDKLGRERLQELRLRINRPPELILSDGSFFLENMVSSADLQYTVNSASQYSPWRMQSIADGYITAQGGHRLGICGEAAVVDGRINAMHQITSICLRVARDFPGIAHKAAMIPGSILIIGSPGRGKTTLLRDLVRQKSNCEEGAVAVLDERRELFPVSGDTICFSPGLRTEVLSGCRKASAVETLIRTMNPSWLAVDEITADTDCQAIVQAAFCGVSILATAHSADLQDFMKRPVYKPLLEHKIFLNIILMHQNKSWTWERMNI